MENPWDSSPWTSDSAPRDFLPVPLPSLPTEPQQIHIASPGEESRLRSASPWGRIVHDETPWGGWGDGTEGKSDAGSVDGWKLGGESTTAAGAAAAVAAVAVVSLPDPWTLEEKEMTGFGGAVDERSADFVISVEEEGERDGERKQKEVLERMCLPDEVGDGACDDAWAEGREGQAEGGKEEREDRSASPGLTQLVQTAQTARDEGEEGQQREEGEGGQEGDVIEESRSGNEMQDSRVQVDDNGQGPKIQEVVGTRQVSKVQELVHMYDGMAKIRTRPADLSLQEVPSSSGDAMVNVATGDYIGGEEDEQGTEAGNLDLEENGDVEDLRAEESKEEQESPATEPKTECEVSATDSTAAIADIPTSVTDSNSSNSSRATDTITTQNSPPSIALPYPIDFSNLDELFPGTETTSSIQPAHLPDISTDPFSSVAQRKAWYRLSRPGSLRKHNLGDDDTYVRVSWHNSHIRHDVLTTVRRWLEEDSLAGGRMLLGRRLGNRAGASMFNWDSDAPGVHISELLSQKRNMKKGAGHARLASAAVQGTTSPIDASFGWSTSVPTSPLRADTGGSFSSMAEQRSEERPSVQRKEAGSDQGVLEAGPWSTTAMKSDESLRPSEKAPSVEEDDEDDWGEMVSSPTVDTHHASFHMDTHTRQPSLDTMRAGLSSPAPDLVSPSDDVGSHVGSSTNRATQSTVRNVPNALPNPWDGLDLLEGSSAAWATMNEAPPGDVLTSLTTTADPEIPVLRGAEDVGPPSGAELSKEMLPTRTENDFAVRAEIGGGCPPGNIAMSGGAFPIPTSESDDDLHDDSFPPSSLPPPSIPAMTASSFSIPAKAGPKPPTTSMKTKTTTNLKLSTTTSKTSTQSTFDMTEAPAIAASHNPGSTATEETLSDGTILHMLRDLPDLSYMLR
ncbi:hypothetical protein E4U59_004172 [Claviceps monticola]|nr:hypothetical protein E4U59_004172 [Claviceps monticola]